VITADQRCKIDLAIHTDSAPPSPTAAFDRIFLFVRTFRFVISFAAVT
jgi:hypothetical protein